MQCLDAGTAGAEAEITERGVAVKEAMDVASRAGHLAPELDLSATGVKPSTKQRSAVDQLRHLLVCVRSEAARYGPERWVSACISGSADNCLLRHDGAALSICTANN